MREKGHHLGCLARVAECDDDIAIGEETEIAVQGVLAAKGDGRRSGAVQGGDQFFADAFGFSHANHDDFLLVSESFLQGLNCEAETIIEAIGEPLELGDFDAKHGPAFFDEIHGERVTETLDKVNPRKPV